MEVTFCLNMSRTQLLFCLFGLSAAFFLNAEARLDGEGIIGGDDADEGDYPYQISLEIQGKSICGGSILAERYVITAAHCVIDEDGSFMGYPLTVVAGVNNLYSSSKYRVSVGVSQVFVPKEYDPTLMYSRPTGDIAILKLRSNLGITANPNLGKVKLPEEDETYANVEAVVSGFGWNKVDVVNHPLFGPQETGGMTYEKMRYAKAKVVSNAACQRRYPDPISPKHICAAVVQRSARKPEGVCSGDSGGPLVYNGAQIGIVSTSPLGCREDSVPAVYTRVSKYVSFVKKVMSGKIDSSIRTTTLRYSPY